ncbi:hypothetical protein AX17_005816 [Amanita inopinata Kibby_2008]|nr:hypothetical protein AX17_005816 [Amanita inopinata Kibby_2008]
MEGSFDDTDSIGDPGDDGQLTIKIPNPKVYKARQSLWIGRRGKPRCDHCRLNNLKCDRVLPTCNHCSWASGRVCKYTPLPTPAHRGIPRCDRCRVKNLKCDRNLPVCNFCNVDDEGDCNYTPKKRHRLGIGTAATPKRDASSGPSTPPQPSVSEKLVSLDSHTFYGQNIASTSFRKKARSPSPSLSDLEASSDPDIPLCIQTGRSVSERSKPASSDRNHSTLQPIAPKPHAFSASVPFAAQDFPPSQGLLVKSSTVEPWDDAAFVPLPDFITRRLNLINSVEIPDRRLFNDSLQDFLAGIMDELRETACLSSDVYSSISHALAAGDSPSLSDRLRAWMSFHHLCLGSDKKHLLLIPRDPIFTLEWRQAQRLHQDYRAYIDEQISTKGNRAVDSSKETQSNAETSNFERRKCFERIPVQPQIYDILTYVHRSHDLPLTMMTEIRQLGFAMITWPMAEIYARLCPLCHLRGKQESTHSKQDIKQKTRDGDSTRMRK